MRRVDEIMNRPAVAFSEETCLGVAVDTMRARHLRHLCVVRELRVVGVVSDRDVKRALPSTLGGALGADYEAILNGTPLSRVMTREPTCISSDAPFREAVRLMLELKISALPVVHDGALVGIITETDCLRALAGLLLERTDEKEKRASPAPVPSPL